MLRLLKYLFLDKRARTSLEKPAIKPVVRRAAATPPSPPPRERDPATALAEAEARMKRLPPEKAQLVRTARLIHRASQSALGNLSDEERTKLQNIAENAFLGGRK